ncbi:hypothetical protein EON65_36120 [archaeon]|nr:MAG: hypothetical protein EON65_36120 [archaeon]
MTQKLSPHPDNSRLLIQGKTVSLADKDGTVVFRFPGHAVHYGKDTLCWHLINMLEDAGLELILD